MQFYLISNIPFVCIEFHELYIAHVYIYIVWIHRNATSTRIIKHSIEIMLIQCTVYTYMRMFYMSTGLECHQHSTLIRNYRLSGSIFMISFLSSSLSRFRHFHLLEKGVNGNGWLQKDKFFFLSSNSFALNIYCYCNCILFSSFCSFWSLKKVITSECATM